MPTFSPGDWILSLVAALGIGVSKSGLAGLGLFHVSVFAMLFGARESTGVVLPMLIVGDISSLIAFRRHAQWDYVRRLLPPTLVGIVLGWLWMQTLDGDAFRPLIGGIILTLAVLQAARMWRPAWFSDVPHAWWFCWSLGLAAGVTTMLANAAGPIIALYFLAVAVPKLAFVGTSAWLFLILNTIKIPFSVQLGLIDAQTLGFNLQMVPAIVLGILLGRQIVPRIPQRIFDAFLLCFVSLAALKMMGLFG